MSQPQPPPSTSSAARPKVRPWLLIFGVILPLVTLGIELATHQCAATFFDPLPRWGNVILVALVPLANLALWVSLRNWEPKRLALLVHANVAALLVALIYTVLFVPLTPLAVIALAIFGWGLLPLTPCIALIFTLRAAFILRQLASPEYPVRRLWLTVVLTLVLLLGGEGLNAMTRHGLRLADSPVHSEQMRGLKLLRIVASRETLLKACYGQLTPWITGRLFDEDTRPESMTAARKTYFRITGEPYNSAPKPQGPEGTGGVFERSWDSSLGGTEVADKVPGLTVVNSRLDGKIQARALNAYLEWTLVFKNDSQSAAEARTQLELPPGAAVSRLTLWINGEPREAAFGKRSQVRTAYQQVVSQRRDPVLVTTCGPDRVLVQCFPVPAHGEMRVRIGITSPLRLIDERRSAFSLPRIAEANFSFPESFKHDLWLESDVALGKEGTEVRRQIPAGSFNTQSPWIAETDGASTPAWTDDPTDPQYAIRQTVSSRAVKAPAHVVVVVDGSKEMASRLPAIADALQSLAGIDLVFAGEEVVISKGPESTAWLKAQHPRGGTDNLSALVHAWDLAAAHHNSALLWIHGPQPVLLDRSEPLLQRLERERTPPPFYDLALGAGPNRILEELGAAPRIHRVDLSGDPVADLRELLEQWRGHRLEYVAQRERVLKTELQDGAKSDRQLARLWGLEEVLRRSAGGPSSDLDNAIKLALELQIVTPFTGAVVLETAEQYRANDLQPGNSDNVPSIPEPGEWLLIAIAVILLWLYSRRRRLLETSLKTA